MLLSDPCSFYSLSLLAEIPAKHLISINIYFNSRLFYLAAYLGKARAGVVLVLYLIIVLS